MYCRRLGLWIQRRGLRTKGGDLVSFFSLMVDRKASGGQLDRRCHQRSQFCIRIGAVLAHGEFEQTEEEYLRINPLGRVPAFVDNGVTLVESLAILEYIDEVFTEGMPLLPKDSVSRAKARAVALQVVAGIQPFQNSTILTALGEQWERCESPWAKKWIEDGFVKLERLLSLTAGKFCVGDAISIADLCLVPQVFNAKRHHVDLSQYPIIKRIDEELMQLPAFIETHPSKQPDALELPEELRLKA